MTLYYFNNKRDETANLKNPFHMMKSTENGKLLDDPLTGDQGFPFDNHKSI